MVDLRVRIGPNHRFAGAVRLCSSSEAYSAAPVEMVVPVRFRLAVRGAAGAGAISVLAAPCPPAGPRMEPLPPPAAGAALIMKAFGLAAALNGGFVCGPFGLAGFCGFLLSLACGGQDSYARQDGRVEQQ